MGSFTRVNIAYADLKDVLSSTQLPIYGALLDGDNIYSQELAQSAVIIMGNESKGISEQI